MAGKTLALIVASLAVVSMVRCEEIAVLDMMINFLQKLTPCAVPCMLKRHVDVERAVTSECMPDMNRSIIELGNPRDAFEVLDNPAKVCKVYDAAVDCQSDLLGRFCSKSMKSNFDTYVRVPLRKYLDCGRSREDTLLRCMTHSSIKVVHQACAATVNDAIEKLLAGRSGNHEDWYATFLSDPNDNFCPIVRGFFGCEAAGVFAANGQLCSQAVVDKFKKESTKIIDFFLCNTSQNMDALPCLANPETLQTIGSDCVPKIADIFTPQGHGAPEGPSKMIERLFDSSEKLTSFLQCVRRAMAKSPKCQPDGWALKHVDYLINPILDLLNDAPGIGQCNCEFPDYPIGTCPGSGAVGWRDTLGPLLPMVMVLQAVMVVLPFGRRV